MKKIAIFGAGGFGKEVACLIAEINEKGNGDWQMIGFFDDQKPKGTQMSRYGEVIGNMDDLNSYPEELAVAIAVGTPKALRSIHQRIVNKNVYFPNLIGTDFWIEDEKTFKIGIGNILKHRCFASCDVSIGDFNVFNSDITFGHDVVVGNYNVIMPDVRVSGEVVIDEENFIGVGSIILQQIKIGKNVRLGAGAVLMTTPKDGFTYIGNPAKRFNF